ncbi:MAG: D-glycero-beta-D-manno-heptose 1,7-bisphosphate 7-phosphatase [Pseudomonadales bacterium]
MKFKLILLDRDGVINEDSPDYIKSPQEWQPIPGSLNAIGECCAAGALVAVCSNQAGIGRGILTRDALIAIHEKMHDTLRAEAPHAELSAVLFCPHHPDDGCECRKPRPGMLLKAMQALQISSSQTCFVGDSITDLQAAQSAGIQPVLVRTGNGAKTEAMLNSGSPDELLGQSQVIARAPLIYNDLSSAATALLGEQVTEPL